MNKPKTYFPNLYGLRAIAALIVLFSHVELLRNYYGLENHYTHPAIMNMGGTAVTLFFVLSGFLITFLLMREKQATGTIHVGKFYLRRILRIWPLYYAVVIGAFFILPQFEVFHVPFLTEHLSDNFYAKWWLFALLLPTVANAAYIGVPFAQPAWSVGVEEQFYLIWPWLIKWCKQLFPLFMGTIIVVYVLKLTAYGLKYLGGEYEWYGFVLGKVMFNTRMDAMAIGAIGAWVYFRRKEGVLRLIYLKETQSIVVGAILVLMGFGIANHYVNQTVYAALFALLIVNLATNPKPIFRLESNALNYLGKISFGIYLLHEPAIAVSKWLLAEGWGLDLNATGPWIALYALTLLFTIVFASISWYGMEKWFIRMKPAPSKPKNKRP